MPFTTYERSAADACGSRPAAAPKTACGPSIEMPWIVVVMPANPNVTTRLAPVRSISSDQAPDHINPL